LLDSAIAGTQTITADTTLSTTAGASNQARQAILLCSPASVNITITAPAQSKIYTVINTSATYTVKIRGVGPTTGVTLAVSESAVVAWNGTDFIRISSNTATTGNFTVNGNLVVTGNTTLGDADTDTITQSASYVTGTQLKSAKTATNTLALAAYDTDGAAYTNLITLTASTTPTLALTSTGVGTINNMSIGATTATTGAFTTLSASGVTTVQAGTALLPAITPSGDPNTGIWFPAADTIAFTEGGVESMRIDSVGNVSIGTTQNAFSKLYLTNTFTDVTNVEYGINSLITANNASGATSKYSVRNAVVTASSYSSTGILGGNLSQITATVAVAGSIQGYRFASGNSGAGVVGSIYGYVSTPPTNTGGGSITNFYGFNQDDVTTATNVYGFIGNVASGANKFNLYMSGTANNYLAGSLGIGSTSLTGTTLRLSKTITGSVSSYGILSDGTIQSDVTTDARYYRTNAATAASAFTLATLSHFYAAQSTIGATSAVTSQFGFHVESSLTGATNNYGFYSAIASGANRWNLYMAGTADNYFAGNVGIGVTPSAGQSLVVGKDITGAVGSYAVHLNGTIQSGVTSVAYGVRTNLSTVASAFTLANLRHHDATQGTFGAGSTVTNQSGFFVDNSLIGATNNYGFFGNIPSGTSRWNFYAGGTADNYFAGNVGIGKNNPSTKLEVAGSVATAIIRINRTDNAAARGALQWTGNDDVIDWQIGTNMVSSGGLEFSTASASGLLMTLDTTGNLSTIGDITIGSAAATSRMFRALEIGGVGNNAGIAFGSNGAKGAIWGVSGGNGLQIVGGTGGPINFGYASGDASLYANYLSLGAWTTTGLGIGTSSPAALLDVDKSQNSTTSIRVGNTNAGSSANSRLLVIADAGNIQVKAMSSTNTTYGAADCGVINCDTMSGGLRFSHNDTVGMTLDSSNNLGIGTASPTSLLQTAGTSAKSAFKTPNIAEVNTISATAATGTIAYDVTTQSVLYYTTNASGNFTVNFRGSSGTTLNTVMQTGESISATFLVTNGATAYYNSAVQVDGSSVTPKWQGGTAPTSGNASSIDSYTYVIIKTGSAAFTVLASVTKFA
jgi:hypothetical protein